MKTSLGFSRSLGQPRSALNNHGLVSKTAVLGCSSRSLDWNGHSNGQSTQRRGFAVRYTPGLRFTEFGIGHPVSVPKSYGRSKLPRRRGHRGKGPLLRDPKYRCKPAGYYDFMDYHTLVQAIRNCPSVVDRDRFPSPNELELYYKNAWKSVNYHGGPDYMAQLLNLTPYRNFVLSKNEFPTWVEEENILKRIQYFQRRLDSGKVSRTSITNDLTSHLNDQHSEPEEENEEEGREEEEGGRAMAENDDANAMTLPNEHPSPMQLNKELSNKREEYVNDDDPASKILQSNHNPYRGLVNRELYDRNSVVKNIQGKTLTKVHKNRVIRKAYTAVGTQLKSMDDLVTMQKRDHFKRKTRWMRHLQMEEERAHDETMHYNEKLEDAHPYRTKEDKRFMRFLSLSGTHILLEDHIQGHIPRDYKVDHDLDTSTRMGRFRRYLQNRRSIRFKSWGLSRMDTMRQPHQIKGERVR